MTFDTIPMLATYQKVSLVWVRVTGRERKKEEEDLLGIAFQMRWSSTSKTAKTLIFLCINVIKHVFWDKRHVANLSHGLESVSENSGEREKVRASRFTRYWVSDALIFDPRKSENVVILCINAIKQYFWDNPHIGNLSKVLVTVGESNGEREKVRKRRCARYCYSDALLFDRQVQKKCWFLVYKCDKTCLLRQTLCRQAI